MKSGVKITEATLPDDTVTVNGQNDGNGLTTVSNRSPQGVSLDQLEAEFELTEAEMAEMEADQEATQEEFLPDAYYGTYPMPKDGLSEVIIPGTDDRVRITPTTAFPWRAICALKITAASGRSFIGTGWLISRRTVITAGHCVFMHGEGGWVRSVQVIPGKDNASEPYGRATGTTFRSVTGWTSGPNANFDYGAIILPAGSLPNFPNTNFFKLAVLTDNQLLGKTLNLSGYPGDKGGNQQWFHYKRPKSVTTHRIVYDIDTMGGQSGSPVWYLSGSTRYAVGVHTNGHVSGNSATRIRTAVRDRMLSWLV